MGNTFPTTHPSLGPHWGCCPGWVLHPCTPKPPGQAGGVPGGRTKAEDALSWEDVGGCGSPWSCAPPAPGWCGYPQPPPESGEMPPILFGVQPWHWGITKTHPAPFIGDERVSCSPVRAGTGTSPLLSLPRVPCPPRPGGLRRGAGQQGHRAGGGGCQRGRGAAGGPGGSRCRGRCRSSGFGPPAAPAAGSAGRWHSRWPAGCPGPLQSKDSTGHQGHWGQEDRGWCSASLAPV